MNKYFGIRGLLMMALMMVPFLTLPVPASATLSITPLIGFFEGRTRYVDVNLINTSDKRQDYEVKWRFYKMIEETGLYEEVAGSTTEFDLSKHLVYTPKRMSLGPSQTQKVRLALRLNGEPPAAGDYRAHLEFKQATKKPSVPEPKEVNGKKGANIGISMNVGFSIPIVYRVGESNVTPVIGDVSTKVNPNSGVIEAFVDVSKGNSPYGILGNLQIFYGDIKIGEVRNGNIFPEVTKRRFVVPLSAKNLSGGSLRIVYKHYDSANKTVFAEKTVPIGQ